MKLNPDCIRDIMLFCEKYTYIKTDEVGNLLVASYHVLYASEMRKLPPLNSYDAGELIYHIIQLVESGYLASDFRFDPLENFRHGDTPKIYYVTPKGHEFIASIEEKKNWAKTKKVLGAIGSVSLSVIETISKGVATVVIEKAMAQVPEG